MTNERWRHGNLVLAGDAAHTTHFTIGSGTKLAIEDAIGLAGALDADDDLVTALAAYERDRKTSLVRDPAPLHRPGLGPVRLPAAPAPLAAAAAHVPVGLLPAAPDQRRVRAARPAVALGQ